MTNVIDLANRVYRQMKYQQFPEPVSWRDLTFTVEDAIRSLYTTIGKGNETPIDYKFIIGDGGDHVAGFEDDLTHNQCEWVVLEAQILLFKAVQAAHDDDVSYTTDAMSLTHGDKPFEHIGQTIDKLEYDRNQVWYRMVPLNTMGVT